MSAIGVDRSVLPRECGKCKHTVDPDKWETRIFPQKKVLGGTIKSALVFTCPKCKNEMSSYILVNL